MQRGKFYITTAIDYANNLPHLGTAYEKIVADAIARFKKLQGFDVYFLIGNDEHSINVKREANLKGLTPKEYCGKMADKFKTIWKQLNISYSDFIRTTQERHRVAVQKFLRIINERKDIYKGIYEGWYCESCEAFLRNSDLVNGKCPNHNKKPKLIKEENYFFSLSKYEERLVEIIERNPKFIQPEVRRNEILSFTKDGLEDVSISRSSFDWGIPFPSDESQIVWVWPDALLNYISALGYGQDGEFFEKYWPADVHVIGKDIIRFHCVIWPAMLLSAGLQLPKSIFAHGFIYFKGQKMSKSLGTFVRPSDVMTKFGSDALRYFLLREVTFGQDGDFSWERFTNRYNSELADDLGNLVNRVLVMTDKYLDQEVSIKSSTDKLTDKITKTIHNTELYMDNYQPHLALKEIWHLIREANRYVETTAPWNLAKNKSKEIQLQRVIYNLLESLRVVSVLIHPFMPTKAQEIWNQLGLKRELSKQKIETLKEKASRFKINLGKPIFPKIR